MKIRILSGFLLALSSVLVSSAVYGAEYKSSANDTDNVRGKLYPKNHRFELSLPAIGYIPNQSYIDSFIINASVGYYFAESWGIHLELASVFNGDKEERFCLEHFYNDPDNLVAQDCPSEGDDILAPLSDPDGSAKRGANFGPVYAPIRELDYLAMATLSWNPIYGKQLALLSFISYFDLFLIFGGGVAFSTYYPESLFLRNGDISRGSPPTDFEGDCPPSPGICPSDPNIDSMIGDEGRPEAENQVHPAFTLGIGQKFHFLERYHVKLEARNYTLIGTEEGIDTYYALWLGGGVRF